MRRILKITLLILLALTAMLLVICGIYFSQSNSGDETAFALINTSSNGVTVKEKNNTIAFVPSGEIQTGIVFYP